MQLPNIRALKKVGRFGQFVALFRHAEQRGRTDEAGQDKPPAGGEFLQGVPHGLPTGSHSHRALQIRGVLAHVYQ